MCDKCEIQLSYAIGIAQPVSIFLEDFNTAKIEKNKIVDFIVNNLDLSPKWIIDHLDLRKPIYKQTASYGHFGNENYSWEKLDKVEEFKKLII